MAYFQGQQLIIFVLLDVSFRKVFIHNEYSSPFLKGFCHKMPYICGNDRIHACVTMSLKGLLHCFSTCNDITGNNWYCFTLKNIENCKKKFQRVEKLKEIEILISLEICKDSYDVI